MNKLLEERFSISYDSEKGDFKNHEIDALVLGRSILGVYDAVAQASELINKGAEVELKVSSPVREGSVVIDFLLLASNPAALSVLKYLGFSAVGGAVVGGSLIEIVKRLKNRRVASVTVENESDVAVIEVDGEQIECDKNIAMLAVNKKVRDSLHGFTQAPLSGRKDAKFKVLNAQDVEVLTIGENASHNFSPLPVGSLEEEEEVRESTTVCFVQVNFEARRGWRIKLADGAEHAVEVSDEKFMAKVKQNKQSFSKEDLFEVVLERKSIYRQTRSTHSYTVVEVTRHFAEKGRRLV